MEKSNSKIFGIRAVIEAIKAGESINKVFIQKENKGPLLGELIQLVSKHKIPISYVPFEKIKSLAKNNNHQGVVAEIAPISFKELDDIIVQTLENKEIPLFIILDRISDVRNFGAIIRTAECCGVHGIVIPKNGNAPVNAEAVKTSAGAAFNVPICKVDHIKDAIFQFQASDISIVGATEKTDDTIYDVNLTKGVAIIMGSEDKGISDAVLKMCDTKAKLPLLGTISSLNVSVACGAILYETVRQRSFSKK